MSTSGLDQSGPLIFFPTPGALREWLRQNHASARELWVGFHRKAAGRPSITWPEAVDEALCYGWIDGLRKSVDATSYKIRFTPRKKTSTWSLVNSRRLEELTGLSRMRAAGLRAFAARSQQNSSTYSYENRKKARLTSAEEKYFRSLLPAWSFFKQQRLSYQQMSIWWIVSAKREETRQRRLRTLVDDCAAGRKLKQLDYPKPSQSSYKSSHK